MSDTPDVLLEALEERLLALRELLGAEREALAGFDPEHLEQVSRDKARVVESVNALTVKLTQAWGKEPGEPEALRDCLRHGTSEAAAPSRARLAELLHACERENRRNALLVQRLQWSTRQALSVLRGGDGSTPLYRPSGRLQEADGRRHFGKA